MNPEEDSPQTRKNSTDAPLDSKEVPSSNLGKVGQTRKIWGKKNSVGGRKIELNRCVTPVDFPDLDEGLPDTDLINREVPNVLPTDEETPKEKQEDRKEEEDIKTRVETVEELIKGQPEPRITGKQIEYPKNIVKMVAGGEGRNTPKNKTKSAEQAFTMPTGIEELRSCLVPLRDPWLTAPNNSASSKEEKGEVEEERKDELEEILNPILTDPTQHLQDKIEILREELGCEICDDNKEAFTTTITVCMKCRPVLKKKKRGRYIWRWVEGIVFVLLLAAIATLSYYVSVNGSGSDEQLYILKEKYELAITALNSTKDYIIKQQSQIINLSLTLDICQKRAHRFENKLMLCEETFLSLKEDMSRTLITKSQLEGTYRKHPQTQNLFQTWICVLRCQQMLLLLLLQSSAREFYFKTLPAEFFTITYGNGINLWKYSNKTYSLTQMIGNGRYKRGEMNEKGIYVAAGYLDNTTYIFDMKYLQQPGQQIKLLNTAPHPHGDYGVYECFLKDSNTAICCDLGGFMKKYDLTNLSAIPEPTIFNKSSLSELHSCRLTKDKKNIIAAGLLKLYILDANDGTLKKIHDYSDIGGLGYASQIAEIGNNILVIADKDAVSVHNITDINNPVSFNLNTKILLNDIEFYLSVIALQSNPGYFAIGGQSSINPKPGIVFILKWGENNEITLLKSYKEIEGAGCDIYTIKEIKRGSIVFGGYACTVACMWNYAAIPTENPLCWDDQISTTLWDVVPVPY